jgi:hypothetical protein
MTRRTYPALWSDNGGEPLVGVVELDVRCVRLEGSAAGREACRRIAYESIASLRMGRNGDERLAERPVLVLVLADATPDVRISMTQAGALHELAETLTEAVAAEGAKP